MLRMGKKIYHHVGIVCVTGPNPLKMAIRTGAMKSLGRTLKVLYHSPIMNRLMWNPAPGTPFITTGIKELTLYVLNFSEEMCIYIIYIYAIPPHWHGIGSWNPSSCKTRINLSYTVNIMGADILVIQGARVSATMIFTMFNWFNSVPTR